MRPDPRRIAGRKPPTPAQQLLTNLDTYKDTPLLHEDVVGLAHALEQHDHIPIAPPWAAARRTAVWVNHHLLTLQNDRLVPTDRAWQAIAAWAERSIDPGETHGEPTSPLANGKANDRDTHPHPGAPTIATAYSTHITHAYTTTRIIRVGMAAVSSTGRWAMINYRTALPHPDPHPDHRTAHHALRAIAHGARLHPDTDPIVLTPNSDAHRTITDWRNGHPAPDHDTIDPDTAAFGAPLTLAHLHHEMTTRTGVDVHHLATPHGHPLHEMALSLAKAAARGKERQPATRRPWSDVAADMAASAATAWAERHT